MNRERAPKTTKNRLIAASAAAAIALSTAGCDSNLNGMFKNEQPKVGLKGAKLPAELDIDLYMVNRQTDPTDVGQPVGVENKSKHIGFIDRSGAVKVDFRKPDDTTAKEINCGIVTYKRPADADNPSETVSVAGYAQDWPGRTDGTSCRYEFNDNESRYVEVDNGYSDLQEAVLTQVDHLGDVLTKAKLKGRLAIGNSLYAGN